MEERRIEIPSGRHLLEAAYQAGSGQDGAVICHPHPLYGGNMDNNVVLAVQECLAVRGWATLRFNFRGVGSSGGQYGNGEGETEDLLAAFDHLQQSGCRRVHVAGYSFGAWTALRASGRAPQAASLCLISPPIDLLDFSTLTLPRTPTLITVGDSDSFCAVTALRDWLAGQGADPGEVRFEIIEGCDHFYWGHEATLASRIAAFVKSLPVGNAAGKTDPPKH
jgi:hypothetical protein